MQTRLTELYARIAALGRVFGAQQILLFGSRARGDHRERSDMIKDRNQTSHIYQDELARAIFARICTDYLQELQTLCDRPRREFP